MAKHYSEKYLLKLNSLNPKRLGVQFGKVCVKANLPPSMVADTVGVTRQTVHNWFRGGPVRERSISKIEKFIDLLDQYLEAEELPVSSTIDAKKFIDTKVVDKL